ncbi:MAG: HIT family protein [Candidatus Micrarchaeaceae archaeon]
MKEDVFCTNKIYDGVFFESKYFIVVYDTSPVVKGHSLVIPKRHLISFIDLTENEIEDFLFLLKTVVPKLIKLYGDLPTSYNLITQVGPFSGMSIQHLHTHILPRKSIESKDVNSVYRNIDNVKKLSINDYNKEVKKLRKVFNYTSKLLK